MDAGRTLQEKRVNARSEVEGVLLGEWRRVVQRDQHVGAHLSRLRVEDGLTDQAVQGGCLQRAQVLDGAGVALVVREHPAEDEGRVDQRKLVVAVVVAIPPERHQERDDVCQEADRRWVGDLGKDDLSLVECIAEV